MTAIATPRAGQREWLGLAVLALACLLYAMDLTVLHLAVPSLSEDLRPSSVQLLWITDIYGFMVAGFLITMGTLGDRIGRRRLLLLGATAFGGVSVLAAFSTSPEMLIACRALLGIAGATLAPSTLSLIFAMFSDPRQRSTAIGVWITSFSAGGAIGPVLGGVLLEHYWWGSVFLLAVPVMALLLVLGPRVLPEYRDPGAGRLDLLSATGSLTAVLAVVFGLKLIAQDGIGWLAVLAVLVGVAVGVGFARRQLRLPDPMVDLRLFRIRAFNASLATNLLGIFIVVGYFLFVAQYLQLVLGLSPLRAGLWSLPSAVGFIIGSNLAPRILRRVRPAYVVGAGLGLGAVGLGVLTRVGGSHDADLAILAGASLLVSLGLAPVFTATTNLVVSSAPRRRATPWAAPSASPGSCPPSSAGSCWTRPSRRSSGGCSSPSRSAPRSPWWWRSWPRSCCGRYPHPPRPRPASSRPHRPSRRPPRRPRSKPSRSSASARAASPAPANANPPRSRTPLLDRQFSAADTGPGGAACHGRADAQLGGAARRDRR